MNKKIELEFTKSEVDKLSIFLTDQIENYLDLLTENESSARSKDTLVSGLTKILQGLIN